MDEPARTNGTASCLPAFLVEPQAPAAGVVVRRDDPQRPTDIASLARASDFPKSSLPYPDLPANHPANVDAIGKRETEVDTRVRLDLACGGKPIAGFEGVDMFADVKYRVNLLQFPWPWDTSSVDEIHSSHFIEHIPMLYGCKGREYSVVARDDHDRDLLCLFFDEAWRVLKPGGVFTVIWPALQSVRAFQDPTHRRFIPLETMMYFQRGFREANGLGHYLGACDFEIDGPRTSHSFSIDEPGRTDEAIIGLLRRNWNVATDTKATLIARK